jgi:glycosyltransferase involved in cell wall biosynthesis
VRVAWPAEAWLVGGVGMYLVVDQDRMETGGSPLSAAMFGPERRATPLWTVLIPFFNEAAFLGQTIASLASQTVPFQLLLVDNGSTDDSVVIARAAIAAHGLDATIISETVPGKVSALRTGLGRVRTRYVATCDADTLYPPHYLAEAEALLAQDGCVVAGAYFVDPGADQRARRGSAPDFDRRTHAAASMPCRRGGPVLRRGGAAGGRRLRCGAVGLYPRGSRGDPPHHVARRHAVFEGPVVHAVAA